MENQFQETQKKEKQLDSVLTTLHRWEDWSILVSGPLLILAFVLWMLAYSIQAITLPVNIVSTLMTFLILLVLEIKLTDTIYHVSQKKEVQEDSDDFEIGRMVVTGIFGIIGLIVGIAMLTTASKPNDAQGTMMGFELALLIIYYRSIIVRRLEKEKAPEANKE